MTTYPMSDEDRAIQDRARGFVDELIPYEVEAEMNAGEIDPEVQAQQHDRRDRARPVRHEHAEGARRHPA